MQRRASTIPKLTSDVRRTWVTLVPSAIVSGFLSGQLTTVLPRGVEVLSMMVLVFTIHGFVYSGLTWWVFHRLSGRRLQLAMTHGVKTESRPVRRMLSRPVTRFLVSGGSTVGWSVQMALAAFVATVVMTALPGSRSDPAVVILGGLAVVACWCTVLVCYAVHYARQDAHQLGLSFPGEPPSHFSDYLYLALMVSASFGTSDVHVTSTRMRRIVAGHTVVAFGFNTVIVAVLVSLLVGAVG